MSFLVVQTLRFKGRKTLPFDATVKCVFFNYLFNGFLPLATTLENLGATRLLAKKVNFVPCLVSGHALLLHLSRGRDIPHHAGKNKSTCNEDSELLYVLLE